MKIILSRNDYSAELAENYGYINRALSPEGLTPFVEELAFQIASYPTETIALVKQAVLLALEKPMKEGLIEETYLFNQSCVLPVAKKRMNLFLQIGGQT